MSERNDRPTTTTSTITTSITSTQTRTRVPRHLRVDGDRTTRTWHRHDAHAIRAQAPRWW